MNLIKRVDSLFSFKNLIYIVVCFIILRLIFSFQIGDPLNKVEDYKIGMNLASGNGYSLYKELGPTAIKTPTYPLLIYSFIKLFGSNHLLCLIMFQHLLIGIVPILIFYLMRAINFEKAGFISAILFLLHPSYFYYPQVLEVTNIFVPCALIWGILFVNFNKSIINSKVNSRIILGISFQTSLLTLIQPIAFFLCLILLVFALRKYLKTLVLVLFLIIIGLSPWIIRNYFDFNKFIPLKSPFWMNLYVGYTEENNGNKSLSFQNLNEVKRIDSLRSVINDNQMEPYYKTAFIQEFNKDKIKYVKKIFYQAGIYWWVPSRYFNDSSKSFLIVRKLPVLILNILFILSLIHLYKRYKIEFYLILSILLYFTLVYSLTQSANIRFKLDIEWLELISIGIYVSSILNSIGHNKKIATF